MDRPDGNREQNNASKKWKLYWAPFVIMTGFLTYTIAGLIYYMCLYLKSIKVKLPNASVYVWDKVGVKGVFTLIGVSLILLLWILFSRKRKWCAILLAILSIVGMIFSVFQAGELIDTSRCIIGDEWTVNAYQEFFDSDIVLEVEGVKYSWDGKGSRVVRDYPYRDYLYYDDSGEVSKKFSDVGYLKLSDLEPIGFVTEEQIPQFRNAVLYHDRKTDEILLRLDPGIRRLLFKMAPTTEENVTVTPYLPAQDAKVFPDDFTRSDGIL